MRTTTKYQPVKIGDTNPSNAQVLKVARIEAESRKDESMLTRLDTYATSGISKLPVSFKVELINYVDKNV